MSDNRLDQILLLLGEVKGDINGLTSAVTKHFEDDNVRFAGIERDIRGIHKKFWFGSGVVATISSMITLWVKGA